MSLFSFPKFKLVVKFVIFLIIISSIPLVLINLLWFTTTRNQIINSTSNEVTRAAAVASSEIDNLLTRKTISLIIHSQTNAVLSKDLVKTVEEFKNFLLQDQDISQLQLLDSRGEELVRMTRSKIFPPHELTDQSQSTVFKVTTFVGGERYISPVYFDESGNPTIDIAVPIVVPTNVQALSDLSTSAVGKLRQAGEILGVMNESIHLTSLWLSLAEIKVGQEGLVYVVDSQGNLLTHPKIPLLPEKKNLRNVEAVNRFVTEATSARLEAHIQQPELVRQTTNEQGLLALTNHRHIKLTNWGVIAQIPLSDVLAATNQVAIFAFVLFLLTLTVVVLFSLFVASQIVEPIENLSQGARLIGAGNLNYRLGIKSGDEIEELGYAFNLMTQNLQDAFERVETSKNIISSERNKLAIVLSGIVDAVMAVDLKRRIITFNKAAERLTGFAQDEVLGKHITQVIRVFDKEREIPAEEYCPPLTNQEGVVWRGKSDLRITGKNDRQAFVYLTVGQIKEGTLANLGSILTFHDVTAERELEEMKLDFVSMAAHELRTPLTSIKGYLTVFAKEYQKFLDKDQMTFITRMNIAADQLRALVDNLLSVARIERGELSLNISEVNWLEEVERIVNEFSDRAREKRLTLKFIKPKKKLPKIQIDALRMSEVLSNLLSNAVAYNAAGGSIIVSVISTNGQMITSVKDTGQGIPKFAIPHLFTKFFRVSGKLEQGSKGTGLGLYICREIVKLHHGRIWVESELGRGSTFSFSLPIGQPEATN